MIRNKYKYDNASRQQTVNEYDLEDHYLKWTDPHYVSKVFPKRYPNRWSYLLPFHLAINKEFIKRILIKNKKLKKTKKGGFYVPDFIKNLPKSMREDFDLMKMAMLDNGQCSEYLGPKLKKNKKFFLEVLEEVQKLTRVYKKILHYDFVDQDIDEALLMDPQINKLITSVSKRLELEPKYINPKKFNDKKFVKNFFKKASVANFGYGIELLAKKSLSDHELLEIFEIIVQRFSINSNYFHSCFVFFHRKLSKNPKFINLALKFDNRLLLSFSKKIQFDPEYYFYPLNKNPDLIYDLVNADNNQRALKSLKRIKFELLDIGLKKKMQIFNYFKSNGKYDLFELAELKIHICKPFNLSEIKKINSRFENYKLLRDFNKKKLLSFLKIHVPKQKKLKGFRFSINVKQIYDQLSYNLKTDHEVIRALIYMHRKFSNIRSNFQFFISEIKTPHIFWKDMIFNIENHHHRHWYGESTAYIPSEVIKKMDLSKSLVLKRMILSYCNKAQLWNSMQPYDKENFKYQKLILHNSFSRECDLIIESIGRMHHQNKISDRNFLKLLGIFFDKQCMRIDFVQYFNFLKEITRLPAFSKKFILERLSKNYEFFDVISEKDLNLIHNPLRKLILNHDHFANYLLRQSDWPSLKGSLRFSQLPKSLQQDPEIIKKLLQTKINFFKHLPVELQANQQILKFSLLFKPNLITKCKKDVLLTTKIDLSELPEVTKKAIKSYLKAAYSKGSNIDLYTTSLDLHRIYSNLSISSTA